MRKSYKLKESIKSEKNVNNKNRKFPIIESINFRPVSLVNQNKGLIGFVSFIYDGLLLTAIAVYTRLNKKKSEADYRLVFPKNNDSGHNYFYPVTDEARRALEKEVSAYIKNVLKNVQ